MTAISSGRVPPIITCVDSFRPLLLSLFGSCVSVHRLVRRTNPGAGKKSVMPVNITPEMFDFSGVLRPGDSIFRSEGCGEPLTLTELLVQQHKKVRNVTLYVGATFSDALQPMHSDHVNIIGFGAFGATKRLAKQHFNIIPAHISQVARYISQGVLPCDVALVQVSPPLEDGTYSPGLMNDYVATIIAKARVVIAEVNDQIPQTRCDATISPDDVDFLVHTSRTPATYEAAAATERDRQIARNVAAYIDDGTTLQIGMGSLPNAIGEMLADRRDLGVHSGAVGDWLVGLTERGAITNARKSIDPGVSVTGALFGTPRLFKFAHQNKSLSLRSTNYTHGEAILANLERLVTINSALEIDLTGQVNAEQIGDSYLGGVGGQADFVKAGHRSIGGRSIIALGSTTEKGVSRIHCQLSTPVVTSLRSDADVVVTEYGAAELRGQTMVERARRLIAIADPRFREQLNREAYGLMSRGF